MHIPHIPRKIMWNPSIGPFDDSVLDISKCMLEITNKFKVVVLYSDKIAAHKSCLDTPNWREYPDHPWSTGISAASRSWAKRLWQRRQIRPRLDLALEHWQPGGSMLILEEIWRHFAAFFAEHGCYCCSVIIAYLKMDWFSWDNLNRKPSIFRLNMGLSCKNSRKTNPMNIIRSSHDVFLNPLVSCYSSSPLNPLGLPHGGGILGHRY